MPGKPSPTGTRTKPAPNGMAASQAAIASIDQLLGAVGLRHGSRKTLRASVKPQRQAPVERRPAPAKPSPNAVSPLQIAPWMQQYPWLLHGFSTRTGGLTRAYLAGLPPAVGNGPESHGELNLGFTATDDRANVEQNRLRLLKAIAGKAATELVTLRQIHSGLVRYIGATGEVPSAGRAPLKGDALLTRTPGLLLAIQTADCIPVLVADTRQRIIAAFHAGWRGTLARIVERGIGRMRAQFGTRPRDLVAAIGPGIGACCYSVGEELRYDFESQFAYAGSLFREVYDSDPIREKYPLLFLTARAPGHSNLGPALHLDLPEANHRQLLDAGVPAKAIQRLDACTACHPQLFFSHRAQHGFTGRMMSVIGIAQS